MSSLTPIQEQVLALLADGSTLTAAAVKAGVPRATILEWRRSSRDFQLSFAVAQYEQTYYWREQLQSLGTLAMTCLRQILMKDSSGVCLRASLGVLDRITKTAAAQPELTEAETQDGAAIAAPVQAPAQTRIPHKSAQSCTTKNADAATQTPRAAKSAPHDRLAPPLPPNP